MKLAFTGVGIPLDNNAPVDGFVMAGPLILSEYPVEIMQAANKGYIDVADNALSVRVSDIESSMAALVTDPVAKTYVDSQDALKLDLVGGILTGALTLFGAPTASLHAATKTYVDSADSALNGRLTTAEGEIDALQTDKANKIYVDIQDATKVDLAGGSMTGLLTLSGAPTVALHAATKAYVDSADATKLALAGGTLTGALTLSGAPTLALHPATKAYVDGIETALDARLDVTEGALVTLNTDPTTKAYVDTQDNLKVAKAGSTMTGLLTLSGDPSANLHATTKQYTDTKLALAGGTLTGLLTLSGNPTVSLHAATKAYVDSADSALNTRLTTAEGTISTLNADATTQTYVDLSINTHASNTNLHLTSDQNTFLDAITVTSTEVNRLTGITSSVQTQIDSKLSKSGGTMTGNLVMTLGTLVTINSLPTNSTDAVNKSYVDGLIQGLKWKDPILDPNLIATGLNTPPASPTAGYSYVVGASPTGVWSAYANRLVSYNGSAWVDVLGRALQVGDRMGVGFEVLAAALDASVSANDNRIMVVASVSPITYTVVTNAENDTTLVTDGDSYYYGSNYTYTAASGWVKVSSNINFSTGTGLVLSGSVLGINLSSGVEEYNGSGASKLRAKLYPNSGLILTTDGSTASTADAASIAVSVDGTTVGISAGKVALAAAMQTTITGKLNKAGDTMTGALTLSGAPTVALHAATKAYADTMVPLAGGTMTGALVLSGAPTVGGHATTKTYVDSADSALNTRLTTAEGTIATLNANPVTKAYVDTQDALKLALTGGTLTGALTLSGAPTVALHAATKAYADTMTPLAGGTMTGLLTLSGAPTVGGHATTKTYVDSADSALNTRLTTAEGTIATLNANPVTKAYVDTADALKLALAGGTMTGLLTLSGAPSAASHATTKTYVDTADALKLNLTGGTLTGALTLSGAPTVGLHAATKAYADTMVPLAGGTMTGLLTLSGAPSAANHAVTKTYVDTANNLQLNLTGGTMTGALTLSGAPTVGLHATTKTYTDTADALKLNKAGDTMTGALTLSGAPTVDLHAATKLYVDSVMDAMSIYQQVMYMNMKY